MHVWNLLHAARWKCRMQKWRKNRHLRTIAQLCLCISSQLRHVSTIGKKLVKQQYLPHRSSQYGELRPTSGWGLLVSLGHHCKFQRVLRLGSVTARQSTSEHQPNFAALNRGHHLYIRQGGHHFGHWPTFLVGQVLCDFCILCALLWCWGISCSVGPIANLKGPYFHPRLSVCVCVCLSVCLSLTGTPILQRWPILMKLGHKDPTLIFGRDHNGPDRPQRDRAMPFWKFKNFSKITEFECQSSGPSFFVSVSPVYFKKNLTRFEQNWRRRYILKFAILATSHRS